MTTNTDLKKILLTRHYVGTAEVNPDKTEVAYLNAYLLSNFGIVLDKPEYISMNVIKTVADMYKLSVPASFYSNPQDIKYYTISELLIEQLVSYFTVESMGISNPDTYFARINVFAKELPEYAVGNEVVLRKVYVLTTDAELNEAVGGIMNAFCAYTRPFSLEEMAEFKYLYQLGFVPTDIACKDNIMALLDYDIKFASYLDKKDMVKLSIQYFGEKSDLSNLDRDKVKFIAKCLPLVRNCPMSKKQAKYFNKLAAICNFKTKKATNAQSPDKLATACLEKGDVVGAARVYAANGSMLERRIKFLLSRATPAEAVTILNMLPAKNPLVLYQTINNMSADNGNGRTFVFHANNKVRKHVETEYEARWRKSRLNAGTMKVLHDACMDKIRDSYRAMGSVGKVYVADNFYRMAIPTNTSANGKGIDVVPTGSRLPITTKFLRTFVYWNGVYDIDANLTFMKSLDDKNPRFLYFGNYSNDCRTVFKNNVAFSGDCRADKGSEYFDIDLEAVKAMGYKYIVQGFHGWNGRLNEGEIYTGYQYKNELSTRAWDPKNIELQFRVQGDSRACVAYAIDLDAMEMVMINLITDDEQRAVHGGESDGITRYFNPDFIEVNCGLVAECRGELVSTPEEADVVFDNTYVPTETQKVVRSYELEKLVALANGAASF